MRVTIDGDAVKEDFFRLRTCAPDKPGCFPGEYLPRYNKLILQFNGSRKENVVLEMNVLMQIRFKVLQR